MSKDILDSYRHVGDGLAVAKDEAWLWMRLPNYSLQFRDISEYEDHAALFVRAINSITPETGELTIHMRLVREPFRAHEWAAAWPRDGARLTADPVLRQRSDTYLGEAVAHTEDMGFYTLVPYMGVLLPDAAIAEEKGFLARLKDGVGFLGGEGDPGLNEKSLDALNEQADGILKRLANTLKPEQPGEPVRRATTREILGLLRAPFSPNAGQDGIPENWEWGSRDHIRSIIDCEYTVDKRDVTITQGDGKSHVTSIGSISVFPQYIDWPQQLSWLAVVVAVDPLAEFSIRAKIIPRREIIRRLNKFQIAIGEEEKDAREYGTEDYDHLADRKALIKHKKEQAESNPLAGSWIDMTCRVQIVAEDAERITEKQRDLRHSLKEAGYIAEFLPNEQHGLMLETMPGGKWQSGLHRTQYDIGQIGATGLLMDYAVGDNSGMYLGYTVEGAVLPFLFDANKAPESNNPPGILVSGKPGYGKTFLSLTLAYHAYLQGKSVVYVDPKADAAPLAKWIGEENVNRIDMMSAASGLLDPFVISASLNDTSDPDLAYNSVVNICTMLTGIQRERLHKDAITSAVRDVIDDAKARGYEPTMTHVVKYLLDSEDKIAHSLGAQLSGFAKDRYGRLLFSDGAATLKPTAGRFTIIVMNGLSLPEEGTDQEDLNAEQQIAIAVLFSTVMFAQRLMMLDALDANSTRQQPKAIFMDEAWTLFATAEGRSATNSILRLGRSMNTAFAMVTQRVSDVPKADAYISTHFAFNPGSGVEDIDAVIGGLGLAASREEILSLERGYCIVRDMYGRRGLVRIDAWNEGLFKAIDTTAGVDHGS